MSDAPITLGGMLQRTATATPDADALVFPDSRRTHADLYAAAFRWAKAFIALGVQPGEHVGILLTTRPEFVEILFGAALAGAVTVPVNARYQANELAFLIRDADLTTLVTSGRVADTLDFGGRLHAALPSLAGAAQPHALALPEAPLLRRILCLDVPCDPALVPAAQALQSAQGLPDVDVDQRMQAVAASDLAFILYTSGTTANPKGAMIPHRAIVCNSRNLGIRYRISGHDKVWSPLPIFHIAGILPMVMVLDAGGAYLTVPFFDPGPALAMLGREGATVAYPSFVTIMQDLITHPAFQSTDLSKLRLMNSNFAVQPAWIREAMVAAMPHTVQVGTYGMTEAAGSVTTSRIDDTFALRTGRLGVPLDDWDVRIVDPDSGGDCLLGARGEIAIRGPNMLAGYYNAPEKTAECLRDGWFYTGDIGSFDASGHIMFHGRSKDMLKVGGENVAAAEIEAQLQSHPAVRLAQVVGLPDDRYAEVPVAFVELADGAAASEQDLIAHCRGKLANFKVPRHIRFVGEWPMSTSKIQKFRLRDSLIAELKGTQ